MKGGTWQVFNTDTGKIEAEVFTHFEAAKLSVRLPAYHMGMSDEQIDVMNSFSSEIGHTIENQFVFSYPSTEKCRAKFLVSIRTTWTEGWDDYKSTVTLDYDGHEQEDRIRLFTEKGEGRPSSQMGKTILGYILDKLKWDFSEEFPSSTEGLRQLQDSIRCQWAKYKHPA